MSSHLKYLKKELHENAENTTIKKKVGRSNLGGKDPIPWSLAKLVCIAAAKEDKEIGLLFCVGFYSGLRFSDILKINRTNIIRHGFKIRAKKTGKIELRPFPPGFYDLLKECNIIITSLPKGRLFGAKTNKDIDISSQVVAIDFKKYCKAAGVSDTYDVSTHTLRKTFARRLYDIADNKSNVLIYICQMFNHSDVSITLRYIGVTKEEIQDLVMNIDNDSYQDSEEKKMISLIKGGFEQINNRIDELKE